MVSAVPVREKVSLLQDRWGAFAGTQTLLLSLLLLVSTLALYYPVHRYPFIDIDDNLYVTENAHVLEPLSLSTVEWAFTHSFVLNYDPLTFFSHNLDVRMFGLNAGRHHDVNVILHALNALLLFWVLKRATGFTGRSFMVAALFALHPIQVENVAWISERKTMLSTLFFLLALGAYRWYARQPGRRRMAVVAVLYGLGLLAKPQVITLPFVLLLWDYWPLRRMLPMEPEATADTATDEVFPPRTFSALVKEKVPLFVIAAVDAVLTVVAQHVPGPPRWHFTLATRLANAIVAYAQYVGKALWPTPLALEYLYRGNSLTWFEVLGASLLLLTITAAVIAARRRRYLLVGWLWFLGTLFPMIGLVTQPDLEALADRYAYISFLGLFLIVCWGVADWAKRRHLPRALLPAASIIVLLVLATMTHRQVAFWSDRITLWTHTLDVTHHNYVADVRLGVALRQQGQTEEALMHLHRAAEESPPPQNHDIILKIAFIEHKRGNQRLAIPLYEEVLAISPDDPSNPQVLANLGHAYDELGDHARAEEYYLEARRWTLPRPAIDWHGAWWRDIGPYLRQRFHEWRSEDTPSPQSP